MVVEVAPCVCGVPPLPEGRSAAMAKILRSGVFEVEEESTYVSLPLLLDNFGLN